MCEGLNPISLESLTGALAYAMGIEPPKHAAEANEELSAYIDRCLAGKKADRVFMYNTDAIAQWVYEKYPQLSDLARERIDLELPMRTVYPSMTPIAFGAMSVNKIKRCLFLGRKAMTSLDSVLKSRDITLLTKVCVAKAMVFPVVMYGCDNWTIRKAECLRIDAFELWCWRRLLSIPWTAKRSNQSILKEISSVQFSCSVLSNSL